MAEMIVLFFESLVVGFSMAAPVGPVGVLCIRRSLRSGWRAGFVTGLGVAVADSLFGLVAGLGLTAVSQALIREEQWMRLFGGLVLLVVGLQIYRARPPAEGGEEKRESQWRNFLSAFILAVTNPLTVLSFAAVFIGLGFGNSTGENHWMALIFVLGIFLGSSVWWIVLSYGAAHFRRSITPHRLSWINKACGVLILLFAVGTLISYAMHALGR